MSVSALMAAMIRADERKTPQFTGWLFFSTLAIP